MKKERREALLEALAELILTAICLLAGYGVLMLFGKDFSAADTDPDLLVLLGLVPILVISAAIFFTAKAVKRMRKKSKGNKEGFPEGKAELPCEENEYPQLIYDENFSEDENASSDTRGTK